MNEEKTKKIGEHIRTVLANQDEEITKFTIDGGVEPNKVTIHYIDSDREISKIETRLPPAKKRMEVNK